MKSPSNYSVFLFQALENEVAIDERVRALLFPGPSYKSLPNCKLIKQVALKNKLKLLYWPLICCSLLAIPFINLSLSIFSFFKIKKRSIIQEKSVYAFATSSKSLISNAIKASNTIDNSTNVDFDFFSIHRLASELKWNELFIALRACLYLYILIGKQPFKRAIDLTLHSLDSFKLILLILFIEKKDKDIFVTDDHYQRWAYLISHHTKSFFLVQHGFLDTDISFKNKYGHIRHLLVSDLTFLPQFEKYYRIENYEVFSINLELTKIDISETALLLASSYPFIDEEIEFLRKLTLVCKIPIIIKLHPSHHYDERKDILLSYASRISENHENFLCKHFVSYNSFLQYGYKQKYVNCFSLKNIEIDKIVHTIKIS